MHASTNEPLPSGDPVQAATAHRPLRDEEDVRRVRRFLADTYARTPLGLNWDVRRWDGQRFYNPDPALDLAWAANIHLWETPPEAEAEAETETETKTETGALVGAVCLEGEPETTRRVHLFVGPAWRNLEGELLAWAEAACLLYPAGAPDAPGLETFVYAYDTPRQRLLAARGYRPTHHTGVTRRMHFGARRWDAPTLPQGYTLRTTAEHAGPCGAPGTPSDCQAIADLLNAAFDRDFHNAQEYHIFTQHAPSFRRDLDLVAVAPDGALAAYVGVPYDADNRLGIFEPVCTHPRHRRLGLAQALMLEGLRRLQALGADAVIVDTGDAEAANRLYDSLGFDEVQTGTVWRKG